MGRPLNVNWQHIRELVSNGITLKQLAKDFDIPYRTLCVRSYRERWNVAAIRANLPPRSKTERKDSRPQPVQLNALKNGVLLPLVKLASYYQSADVSLLRKEQSQFLAFANTALKVLQANDPKLAGPNAQLNLTLLSVRPSVPALLTREVRAATEASSLASQQFVSPKANDNDSANPESSIK